MKTTNRSLNEERSDNIQVYCQKLTITYHALKVLSTDVEYGQIYKVSSAIAELLVSKVLGIPICISLAAHPDIYLDVLVYSLFLKDPKDNN